MRTDLRIFQCGFFVDLLPKKSGPGSSQKRNHQRHAGEVGGRISGRVFGFSQPISDNVQEAVSGVKGEMAI